MKPARGNGAFVRVYIDFFGCLAYCHKLRGSIFRAGELLGCTRFQTMGMSMKGKIQALALLLGCAGMTQAQAGLLDGATGFYAAGGLNVVKATGLLDRRLGGDGDQGDTADNDIPQFRIREPGYNTVLELRGGWQPFGWLGVEGRYGLPLDADEVENADNTQKLKLKSIYGVYLKPKINLTEGISLIGSLGYTDFDYNIRRVPGASDENAEFDLNGNGVIDGNQEQGDSDNRAFNSFGEGEFSWGAAIQLRLSAATKINFEYNQYFDDAVTMSDVDAANPNPNRNRPANQDVQVFSVGFSVTYLFGQESSDDYY